MPDRHSSARPPEAEPGGRIRPGADPDLDPGLGLGGNSRVRSAVAAETLRPAVAVAADATAAKLTEAAGWERREKLGVGGASSRGSWVEAEGEV